MLKRVLAGVVLVVMLTGGAVAGPFEEGKAAYDRGDYATALRLMRPLAERGNASAQSNLGLIYDKGLGAAKWEDTGEILYVRGLINAMLGVEAIRTAQERFGKKPLTGEQVRWGLENLDITAERIKQLGFEGVLQPIKVSCADHEGGDVILAGAGDDSVHARNAHRDVVDCGPGRDTAWVDRADVVRGCEIVHRS